MDDDGWSSSLLRLTDLADGRPVRIEVDGSAVLLVRNGDELFAIGNRCSHQGAPLHRGPVRFGGSLRTVQCPLHGSTFELTSGGAGRMREVEAEDMGRDSGPFGSRLVGVGFGLVVFAVLVMLPFLVPVTFYVLANIYAVIKGTTFSSQTANTDVVLTLLVFSVALWPIGLAVLIAFLGRVLSPKRPRA